MGVAPIDTGKKHHARETTSNLVSEPDPSQEEEGAGHVSTFELSLRNAIMDG